MICYEVNLNIDNEIYSEYMDWLENHVRDMLKLEAFNKADLWKIEEPGETTNQAVIVRYYVDTMQQLDDYLKTQAEKMRSEATKLFSTKLQAQRRIMKSIVTNINEDGKSEAAYDKSRPDTSMDTIPRRK